MPSISDVISGILSLVSKMYNKRQDRKIQKDSGNAKLAQAKQKGDTDVTLTDAEWEAIAVSQNEGSWKDEYVTIIGTMHLVLIFVGAIYGTISGNMDVLNGTITAITELQKVGVDMGEVTMTVIYAAVGLKAWRGVVK